MKHLKNFLILENVQKAKQLLSTIGIDAETSNDFKKIRHLLSGHDGYVYWFTNQFFTKKQSLAELINVWNNIKTNSGLISLFSKKVVDMETIEEFWDELAKVQIKQRVKSLYNEFPAAQKRLVNLENDSDFNLLDLLSQNKGKDVILKKIALYKTKDQLFTAINRLVNYKEDGKFVDILNNVKNTDSKVIYENESESIIICKVNYRQLCTLGGDTAWCIVRSEGTFNSYNSEILSSQYIIFLTDKNDVMSKIGLTTNLYGYNTAHSKNDGYINLEELRFILDDRGFNIGSLYPDKSEIKYNMFGRITSSVLIDYGFTKDEIIKHKQVFRGNDLQIFTEKEIEDNKLLDRTEISFNSLKSFSKETIVEKNLLSRVPHIIDLRSLTTLGFNLKDINSLIKNGKYSLSSNFDKKLYDDISVLRRKSSAIKLLGEVWHKYRDDRVYASSVILTLFEIDSNDITLDKLDGMLPNDFFDDKILGKIRFYTKFGYSLNDVYNFVKSSLNGFKHISTLIVNNTANLNGAVPGLEELLVNDFLKLLNTEDRWGFDLNSTTLSEIKSNIINYPDMYDNLYNLCRKRHISDLYRLRVRSDKGYGGSDFEATIRNINFFGLTANEIPFNKVTDVIDDMGYDWKPVLKFFDKMGYSYSGKEGFEVISKIAKRNDEINVYSKFIANGIYVDEVYKKLSNFLKNNKTVISSYEKSSLKELFAKSDKYKDLWEQHEKDDRNNYLLLTTLKSSKYWSGDRSGDGFEPQAWYDRVFEDFSKINLNTCGLNEPYRIAVGAIVLLAKLGKTKDFSKINFDFLSNRGSSSFSNNKSSLTDLCKIIANKNITNWDYTWRIYLNPKERKSIYTWLVKYIDKNQDREGVTKYFVDTNMLVCYYLFDKNKLKSTIDLVKKTKSNIVTHWYGRDKPTTSTNRLMGVKYLLGYLAEQGKWDDFREYLSEFKDLKMGKEEIKSIRSTLRWYLHFAKVPEEDDKVIHTRNQGQINSKIADGIINEIFPIINENRILKWNEI